MNKQVVQIFDRPFRLDTKIRRDSRNKLTVTVNIRPKFVPADQAYPRFFYFNNGNGVIIFRIEPDKYTSPNKKGLIVKSWREAREKIIKHLITPQ